MFQRVPRPPPSNGSGPFRIAWWQAGPRDESIRYRTSCTTLAEAEEILGWLACDPAVGEPECSWLDADGCEAIPF